MTSLLAFRAGRFGSVTSFEPHPDTFQLLVTNAQKWTGSEISPIRLQNSALSNFHGRQNLDLRLEEEQNKSHASLDLTGHSGIAVDVFRLDEFIHSEIGVMKLDVEGHEAQVIEGAGRMLRNVRDIVFEENGAYPQPSHRLLENAGYKILWFEERLFGLRRIHPTSQPKLRAYDIPPSYLATMDLNRAERLLSAQGWRCL
jgi:FkbM family methyltransferase